VGQAAGQPKPGGEYTISRLSTCCGIAAASSTDPRVAATSFRATGRVCSAAEQRTGQENRRQQARVQSGATHIVQAQLARDGTRRCERRRLFAAHGDKRARAPDCPTAGCRREFPKIFQKVLKIRDHSEIQSRVKTQTEKRKKVKQEEEKGKRSSKNPAL
jgi:hypothetical protein